MMWPHRSFHNAWPACGREHAQQPDTAEPVPFLSQGIDFTSAGGQPLRPSDLGIAHYARGRERLGYPPPSASAVPTDGAALVAANPISNRTRHRPAVDGLGRSPTS